MEARGWHLWGKKGTIKEVKISLLESSPPHQPRGWGSEVWGRPVGTGVIIYPPAMDLIQMEALEALMIRNWFLGGQRYCPQAEGKGLVPMS